MTLDLCQFYELVYPIISTTLSRRVQMDLKAAINMTNSTLRLQLCIKSLRVINLGSGQKSFVGKTVRLETDVTEIFNKC